MFLVPGVVFESTTRPTAAILRDLADHGLPGLVASPTMAEEPILVRFTGQSPEAVKEAIAAATDGRWSPAKDGTLRLVPDDGRRAKDRAESTANRLKALRRAWEDALAIPAPAYTEAKASAMAMELRDGLAKWDPDRQPIWELFDRVKAATPKQRMVRRLLTAFPPERLMELPEGEWVAYGEGSTLYRPLPKAAAAIFSQFAADQILWTDALAKARTEAVMTGRRENYYYPGKEDAPVSSDDRFRIFIRRDADRIRLETSIIPKVGWDRFPAELELSLRTLPTEMPPLRPILKDEPVAFRPVSVELGQVMNGDSSAPSDALRTAMLSDEDPTGYGNADALLQGARAEGKAIVYSPMEVREGFWFGTVPQGRRQSWSYVVRFSRCEERGGITVSRPHDPTLERDIRADRALLRRYLAAIADGETLEERAAYAVSMPWHRLDGLASLWAQAFLGERSRSVRGRGEDEAERGLLRLYGALAPKPGESKTVSYGQWPRSAKLALNEWLYAQRAELKTVPHLITEGYTWGGNDAYILFPSGVPSNAKLTLRSVRVRMAHAKAQVLGKVHWGSQSLTAESIGSSLAQENDPVRFPDYPRPGYSARILQEGTQGQTMLSVNLDGRAGVGGVLESGFEPIGRPGTWTTLSAEFRKSVEQEMVAAARMIANFRDRGREEKIPPR